MKKPEITSSRHILPFGELSPNQFQRLCYWVVDYLPDLENVEHYGMTGDKNRDIIGYKKGNGGKPARWYFQCKKYKRISFKDFKPELDGIYRHSEEDKNFKPCRIVFMTACNVTPKCKEKVRKYAKTLSLGYIFFWTNIELDKKVKENRSILEEFFEGGLNISELEKKIKEKDKDEIKIQSSPFLNIKSKTIEYVSLDKDRIVYEVDESVEMINAGNYEDAKSNLYKILGVIEDNEKYSDLVARAYNNLGVCYNRGEKEGGDYNKAEKYIKLAIEKNPSLNRARANLASVYINKGGKGNYKEAFEITRELWDEKKEREPEFFEVFVWSIFFYRSHEEAVKWYENSEDAHELVAKNEPCMNIMTRVYMSVGDFNNAMSLVEMALKEAPNSAYNFHLKAKILMGRSQKDNIIPSFFDIVPKFQDYKDIELALELLKKALEELEFEENKMLEAQIRIDIYLCSIWLRLAEEAEYREIREGISFVDLEPSLMRQVEKQDVVIEIQKSNFELAYEKITNSPNWAETTYQEKINIAYIFMLRGAPEQSKNILNGIRTEAEEKRDVRFWIDMSMNEVLLGNKNLAFNAVEKAKSLSEGTNYEKNVLSHYNSIMLRYARSGEVDRLLKAYFDYDKKFPEDKIVVQKKAIDEKGELHKELKSTILDRAEWYESVRQTFMSNNVPSYYLEKVYNKTYAEILSLPSYPEILIQLTLPYSQFEEELMDNLESSESFVFDYSSLLNLSKMNLLGHLSLFEKELYITDELFRKIQYELLIFEHEDLRNLWNFLRNSKEISIIDVNVPETKNNNLSDIFDKWFISSLQLANDKKGTFIVDDLHVLRFIKSKNIKGSNSYIALKYMLKEDWIDSKIYSTSIGDLAERNYVFLAFSGEDLLRIASEDEMEIKTRSYHLINQPIVHMSNSLSFANTFLQFILLIWDNGLLIEKKINWINVITRRIIEILDMLEQSGNYSLASKVINVFEAIWIKAIKLSRMDEIELVEKSVKELQYRHYLVFSKYLILSFINYKDDNSFILPPS